MSVNCSNRPDAASDERRLSGTKYAVARSDYRCPFACRANISAIEPLAAPRIAMAGQPRRNRITQYLKNKKDFDSTAATASHGTNMGGLRNRNGNTIAILNPVSATVTKRQFP